jgi:hypothetical protein
MYVSPDGSVPDKLLSLRSREYSDVSCPIWLGIVPFSPYPLHEIDVRPVAEPIHVGTVLSLYA